MKSSSVTFFYGTRCFLINVPKATHTSLKPCHIILYLFTCACVWAFHIDLFIHLKERVGREEQRERLLSRLLTELGPCLGLHLMTPRSWPEPKSRVRHLTNWATLQGPQVVSILKQRLCPIISASCKPAQYRRLMNEWPWHFKDSIGRKREGNLLCYECVTLGIFLFHIP